METTQLWKYRNANLRKYEITIAKNMKTRIYKNTKIRKLLKYENTKTQIHENTKARELLNHENTKNTKS